MKVDSSNALQILLLIGGISILPAILFTVTGFTRILIVLSFVRSALGTQNTPPNQVLIGISLFLTLFVMAPTISAIKKDAWEPYSKHAGLDLRRRSHAPSSPCASSCSSRRARQDLSLFVNLAHINQPQTRAQIPTYVLIPAFIMSELKTAFEIGFLVFLPFLLIDLIVSSTLMSMGMIMLPPSFISLPFKILLFVLVDGWDLITNSLVKSFH